MDITKGITLKNHVGSWYVLDSKIYNGIMLYLLEHEQYGEDAFSVIVDDKQNVLYDKITNGWDDFNYYLDCYNLDNEHSAILNKIVNG